MSVESWDIYRCDARPKRCLVKAGVQGERQPTEEAVLSSLSFFFFFFSMIIYANAMDT